MSRLLAATLAAAALALAAPVIAAAPASATPTVGPPFVDHTEWAKWGDLNSLRVYPTSAGRQASVQAGGATAAGDEAWSEVLAQAPDADLPGMRQQFICHWQFAEMVEPGKTSWNLEPWRPEVSDDTMISTGCNPGGTQEPF